MAPEIQKQPEQLSQTPEQKPLDLRSDTAAKLKQIDTDHAKASETLPDSSATLDAAAKKAKQSLEKAQADAYDQSAIALDQNKQKLLKLAA